MFFKRLEIVGFKSFATKTVLDFLPGITIIVGPNGCGKSNIFDAVRWALGEQRPRVLRGRKMGDVIFSGSVSYKAQSLASVTLTINNEDRRLPIDFSEVQIARRLYKVGENEYESEYLLNRTPCRLRQITDLLLDTGIGTSSYSIMEQGHVDFIINARPPERRYLFDEAVGIAKYRARREEALRKLERTENDLLRLNDLLSEIKSRLRSLKIQANRAERYKHLVAEVRSLERDLLLLGYNELLAEKKKVDERFEAHNAQLQALAAQIAKADQALLDKQVELDRFDRETEQARSERLEAASELERLQSTRAVLRERIETAETQMRRAESQIAALRTERKQLVERRRHLGDRTAELAAELERLETEYETHRERFDALVRSQSDARQRLAELREKPREAVEQRTRHENERRIAALMKQQAEENLAQARRRLADAEERLDSLAERTEHLEAERTERREALEKIRREVERLDALERQQTERREQLERERSELARSRQQAESRRQALRTLQENFDGFLQGVRRLMEGAARGEVEGVAGLVANIFELRPEDELAIETALGGDLQDIVVESAEHADAAIEFLARGRIGRATFLPLDTLSPAPRNGVAERLAGEPGVVGVAADLVRTEPRFRAVAEALLGDTVVVESLDSARRLREKGFRVRFVTRDGTLLERDGRLTGGHSRASGLLRRESEIRELSREIERLEKKLAALDLSVEEQNKAIEESVALRREAAEKALEARNALLQTESALERAVEDRDEARHAVEVARREIERLGEKIAAYERSIEEHRKALEASDTRAAELESQLAEAESARESHERRIAGMQEALAEMMARISASRERLEATKRRCGELDERIARTDEQLAQQTEQLESLSRVLDRACADLERSDERFETLSAKIAELDRRIAARTEKREAASNEIRHLQHNLHNLQRRRNEQQEELHEIDRRRAQCEVQIRNLDEQAREKFRSSVADLTREAGPIETPREELVSKIAAVRGRIESMGEVNVIAIEEHRQLSERYEFLDRQRRDLEEAKASLRKTIKTIDTESTEIFSKGMAAIRERFREMFRRLFGGGRADLVLTDPDDLLNSGIEIVAQPPGKQLQNITLLSGGEKALTAIALLFGIFLFRPSPFCVLDEIDAPLDEGNIERFKSLVLEFSKDIQFIIITHNKQTMALADTLYGVTMEEPGVSRIVSVRFDQLEETALAG